MFRESTKRLLREYAMQGVLLVVCLAVLFPYVGRGETLMPAGLLADTPPWRDHFPATTAAPCNFTLIESFILFHNFYAMADRALAQGEWPLWNPLEFGGMPLLANCQSTVLYPFRLLHSLFDLPIATTLFIVLKLWLCGLCAYACARHFQLSTAAARFASVAWMLSGYNTVWAYWVDPDVAAWLPILIVGADSIATGLFRRGFFAMAIAGVLMLLAGHPESAFTMGLATGAYFFVRLAIARPGMRQMARAIVVATGAWALILLVTAPQTFPFAEYLVNSHTFFMRATNVAAGAHEAATQGHYVPASALLCLWCPRFFGSTADGNLWLDGVDNANFILMLYPGVACWLAASMLLARPRPGRESIARIVALAIPAGLSLLLAIDAPIIGRLHALPLFASIWGCWYLAFPMFALCLLAAMGVDHWMRGEHRLISLACSAPSLAIGAVATAGLYAINSGFLAMKGHAVFVQHQMILAAAFAVVAVICLALCRVRGPWAKLGGALLTLVLAGDLIFAARGLYAHAPRDQVLFDTPLTRHLQELEQPTRINTASSAIPLGLLQPYGIEDQLGYDGVLPERMFTFLGRLSGEAWWRCEPLCATRYYLHDPARPCAFPREDASRFRLATSLDGVDVYENLKALPRAFLVAHVEPVESADALFARMRQAEFDPLMAVITEAPPVGAPSSPADGPTGQASVTQRTSTRVAVHVEAKRACALVLADAYYPGWNAYVDGTPAAVFPAYYAFRGVPVPSGSHAVEFRYAPGSFRIGMGLAIIALLASWPIGLYTLWRGCLRRA